MIRYLPSLSEASAWATSHALWKLCVPDVDTDDVTQNMFDVLTATNGSHWLVVQDDFMIDVHPQAGLDGLVDVIQPYIDAGHVTADVLTTLEEDINTHRGGTMTPWDFFPAFFKAACKTREQMGTLGLIPGH